MTKIGDVTFSPLRFVNFTATAMILVAAMACPLNARALAGTATAEVDRTETVVGEPVQLSVTVEGKLEGGIKLPAIEGVETEDRGTQSQVSTSYQSGSGFTVLRQQVATFVLTPSRKGNFKIPPIVVKVDGETVKTLPIEVRVEAGRSNGPGAAMSRLFDMERDVPRKKIFAGEALPVVIRLLSKGQLRDRSVDQPAVDHVTVIAAGKERNKASSRGGENVFVFEAPQVWVSNKAGKYAIPAAKATGEMLVRGGGFFDSVRAIRRAAEAEGFELEVLPLPAPIPKDFSGLVGKFEVKHSLDRNKLKVGETATLEVILEGSGMIEGWDVIKDLPLSLPSGIKIYAGRPKVENIGSGEVLEFRQRKTFELQLVAGRAGTWNLGQHVLRYFDPSTGKYEALNLDLGSMEVAADENGNTVAAGPITPPKVAPDCPPASESSATATAKPATGDSGTGVDAGPMSGGTLNLTLRQAPSSPPSSVNWASIGHKVAYFLFALLIAPFALGAGLLGRAALRRTGLGRYLAQRRLSRQWKHWSNRATSSFSEGDLPPLMSLMEATLQHEIARHSSQVSSALSALRTELDKRRFGGEIPDWAHLRTHMAKISDGLRGSVRDGVPQNKNAASVLIAILLLGSMSSCQFVTNGTRSAAENAFRDGDFGKLAHDLSELEHAGQLGSDDYFNLGIALYRSGEKAGARAAFLKAVEVNPSDDEARRNAIDPAISVAAEDPQTSLDSADVILDRANPWAWFMSPGAWIFFGLVLSSLFCFLLSRVILAWSQSTKRAANPLRSVIMILLFGGGVLSAQALRVRSNAVTTLGVIKDGGAELTPNGAAGEPPIAKLSPQLGVVVLKESDGACRLQLKDGRRGWTDCNHLVFFGRPAG